MPRVPKLAALLDYGASLKTSSRQVISKSIKPAEITTASSSSSRRAPAIQPVHKSILLLALSGTFFCTRISPICNRPLGLSTRAISRSVAFLSGVRLRTPLEITTSAQPPGTGKFSICPCRNSTCLKPASLLADIQVIMVTSLPTSDPY